MHKWQSRLAINHPWDSPSADHTSTSSVSELSLSLRCLLCSKTSHDGSVPRGLPQDLLQVAHCAGLALKQGEGLSQALLIHLSPLLPWPRPTLQVCC